MESTELPMTVSRGGTTRERIEAFERANQIQLPDDYIQFLLRHNGGEPERTVADYVDPDAGMTNTRLAKFFGLDDDEDDLESTFRYYVEQERVPSGYLPIALDCFGNLLLLRLDDEGYGEIYFWDHEKEHLEGEEMLSPISGSFNGLVGILR